VLRFVEVRRVFGWSWPWTSLQRPIAAFCAAMVPAVALRAIVSGAIAEVASAIVFLAFYVGGWLLLGADPADREVWARLRRR
jgi:hypothetical protein